MQLLLEIDTLTLKTTGCIFHRVTVSHRMPTSARHSVTAEGEGFATCTSAQVCALRWFVLAATSPVILTDTVCSYTGSQTGITNRTPDSSVSITATLPTGTHNKQPGRGVKLDAQSTECPNYESVELYLHSLTSSHHGDRLSTRTASALAYNYHIVQGTLTFCLSTSPLCIVVFSNL